jgi:hypothetical protein
MATTYTLISSVTVGSGGAANITFSSIPSTYTDLLVKVSARNDRADFIDHLLIGFNGTTTNITGIKLYGSGSTAASITAIPRSLGVTNGAGSTSNTFSNGELYIPNYTSSNYKSFSVDNVDEINTVGDNGLWLTAGLWSSTAAITSIALTNNTGANFVQYTTAYLYGISNA